MITVGLSPWAAPFPPGSLQSGSTFHLHVILTAYDLLVQVTHGDSSISVPFLRMGTLIGLGQVPLVS